MKRSYIRQILESINDETISFAGGLPNETLFDLQGIAEVTQKVLCSPQSLQYSCSEGLLGLRQHIADLYTHTFKMPTCANEILITTGSQQAFDIIIKSFTNTTMTVQNPSYIGALNTFRMHSLHLNSFTNLDELSKKLECNGALYLMSDFSNPTARSYTQKQREQIAQILHAKKSLFIEDGAYSLLSFDNSIQKPICASYTNGFHLGSFSKIFAPGLRVGWIRSSANNIKKLLIAKECIDLHTPTLNQMIIEGYLQQFGLKKQLEHIQNDYKNRMETMADCMHKHLTTFEFVKPKGGMFIYGEFKNTNTMQLVQKALQHNVAFVPAEVFTIHEQTSSFARFNFTNSSYAKIEQGIKKISTLLKA